MVLDRLLLASDLHAHRDLLDAGRISSVELVGQQLAAIDASQPVLNAFIGIDHEGALAAAAAADARRAQGQTRALEGVPVAIKANLDVAGMPTTAGMQTRRDAAPATQDSAAVARLRDAGAVILGTLNMSEAALGADTDNPHFGRGHNPHRIGYTPGGSSGGSGAAVAAGLCSAALGTDSMGSVRIPAAYCGVYGLKPGRGVVSTRGSVELSRRLDHVGPLARSTRDLRLLLSVLSGFDAASAQSRAWQRASARAQPLRIGVVDFGNTVTCDADVAAAFDAGVAQLVQLGHQRIDLAGPTLEPGKARRAGLLVCEAEMLVEHAVHWRERRQDFSPALASMLAWAEGKSAAEVMAADRMLDQAQVQLQQWLQSCDVIAMPTAPQRAFAFGTPVPANQADFTAYANFSGFPALSLPLPVADGELPIGMQLIGREGTELVLIDVADEFAQACGHVVTQPAACAAWWP